MLLLNCTAVPKAVSNAVAGAVSDTHSTRTCNRAEGCSVHRDARRDADTLFGFHSTLWAPGSSLLCSVLQRDAARVATDDLSRAKLLSSLIDWCASRSV